MNILAIGNSFSQDAARYVEALADSAKADLFVRSAAIGGCSLERHVAEYRADAPSYGYLRDGEELRSVTLGEALRERKWDAVTVQQVSRDSGRAESFEPWLGTLAEIVRREAPGAEIVLHRTWAYRAGTTANPGFADYDNDRAKMDRAIGETFRAYSEKYGFRVIRAGEVVFAAGNDPELESLIYRDGYHLSLDYGRYAAGLAWLKFFAGTVDAPYAPPGTDPALIGKIRRIAEKTLGGDGEPG